MWRETRLESVSVASRLVERGQARDLVSGRFNVRLWLVDDAGRSHFY